MLSQLTFPIYILFGLQVILLPFQLINFFTRTTDKSRLRFLILSSSLIFFNAFWIAGTVELLPELLSDFAIAAVGVFTICYTYFYWTCHFEVKDHAKKVKWLLLHCLVIFSIGVLLEQNAKIQSEKVFALQFLYAELVALFFAGGIILKARKELNTADSSHLIAIIIGCVFACLLPFSIFLFENFTIKFIAVNAGFFFIAYSYLNNFILEMRSEWVLLEQRIKLNNQCLADENKIEETLKKFSTLTARELEIAKLMVQNLLWKEIAYRLNIEESTARKHGANIYSKFNVSGIEEFRRYLQEHSDFQ